MIYGIIFNILQLTLTTGQTYQNDIPDFFYDVNFAGPIFDQSVYTRTASNFSVASPINTTIFTFYLQLQTNYTRPSFVSASVTGRSLNTIAGIITVTSDNENFTVITLANGSYALITNIFPLNYFVLYHRYSFNLIATQTYANRPPVSSTAIAQINLVNYNVHAPIFIPSNQTFYISQTASVGTIIGTVYASDADNDSIIYTTNSIPFSIDQTTGVLALQQVLSSSDLQYIINIKASDDGSSCLPVFPACPRFSTTINITINVLAINTETPLFLGSICGQTFTLLENVNTNNITSITVYDGDSGRNGQITIAFPSDASIIPTVYSEFNLLQMNQTNTTRIAYLQSNTAFDYETSITRAWYLLIQATDNGIPQRQSVCGVRINLVDANDNPPVFAKTLWNYTIYGGSYQNISNPYFLRILASDADSGVNAQINYYIGTISVPYFTINQTTGMITLRSSATINSLNASYFPITFQVYALDSGLPPLLSQINATVIIYYNSSASQPASWLNPIYGQLNFHIIEKFYETYSNRSIFNLTDGFNGTIYYTTSQSAIMIVTSPFPDTNIPFTNAPISVSGNVYSSGIIVTTGLHAELESDYIIYNIVVVQPPLVGVTTVNLIDQNDQIPTFDLPSLTISILKNQYAPQKILQIQAIDNDATSPNNYVQYSLNTVLTNATALALFYVTSDGSIWTNSTFTSTNQTQYRVIITAYDGAPAWNSATGQPNTANFQLTVTIASLVSSSPVFANGSTINVSINETVANGTAILELTITDPDVDTELNCGILSGNTRNVFAFYFISDNSANSSRSQYVAIAQLYVVGPLSYLTIPNYTLVLFASDSLNVVNLTVIVTLQPQNTEAPYFVLNPGVIAYEFDITEATAISVLDGPTVIKAIDPENSSSSLVFNIYTNNHQLNLNSLYLNQSGNQVTLGLASPGLSRDLPFGTPQYNFSIEVTDDNGSGVSTYVPVVIYVNDVNNNGPIPTGAPWYLTEGVTNPNTTIMFVDFDDPQLNNTVPFHFQSISPSTFSLIPTISYDGNFTLTYNGVLSRSTTTNLSVTFNMTDNKGYPAVTTIPIIVTDVLSATAISDGYKNIYVAYVTGYTYSLKNFALGSIYVHDADDWFRANRTYSVQDASNGLTFSATNGLLSTADVLYPGVATIHVSVTKTIASSTALSTIYLTVTSVDSEYVRKAATIRIQGEFPETLIDPTLGNRLNTLVNALASILSVSTSTITVLAIRPVYQYRSPYYPPLPYNQAKQQALTDVVFYVSSLEKQAIESTLNSSLSTFSSQFGITANASGPNPCSNYVCPTGMICRSTRTIQPLPRLIDTNETSFVGINILDSPDCVNATYAVNVSASSSAILGQTFSGGSYAVFSGTQFTSLAPTRFSFDFAAQSPITDGLILLYGLNTIPINDFFWVAIEIYQSTLRFHFRDTILDASGITLNASTWYHVEYQYVDSTILVYLNDYEYFTTVNGTLNTYSLSNVQLYLGGLPTTGSLISGLYPSLTEVNTFIGCIRNVLSDGYYLDMSSSSASSNSVAENCSCSITNSCTITSQTSNIIIPWYTWLIIALVFLLLLTIIVLVFLACVRRKIQQETSKESYSDDLRDSFVNYRDAAGEEDHSSYNLDVLKKPIYAITDEEILAHRRRGSLHPNDYAEVVINDRPPLGEFIDKKLTEQRKFPYANDTKLHYRYEGEGSITSDLSSIGSSQDEDVDENVLQFLSLHSPNVSHLANAYTDDLDNIQ